MAELIACSKCPNEIPEATALKFHRTNGNDFKNLEFTLKIVVTSVTEIITGKTKKKIVSITPTLIYQERRLHFTHLNYLNNYLALFSAMDRYHYRWCRIVCSWRWPWTCMCLYTCCQNLFPMGMWGWFRRSHFWRHHRQFVPGKHLLFLCPFLSSCLKCLRSERIILGLYTSVTLILFLFEMGKQFRS